MFTQFWISQQSQFVNDKLILILKLYELSAIYLQGKCKYTEHN